MDFVLIIHFLITLIPILSVEVKRCKKEYVDVAWESRCHAMCKIHFILGMLGIDYVGPVCGVRLR